MLYCFLDTNIFLQFKMFDEIDWKNLLNEKEICLVIPKKVIQELDKHKNDPVSARRRDRARSATKKIFEYQTQHGGEIKQNLILKAETEAPKADWLELNGYDPTDPDDCVVGSAHHFKSMNPTYRVILFSDDTGVSLKAHANKIDYLIPPDDLRLPSEPDPLQAENQKLQRELQRFQNAQPKLAIEIENQNGNLSKIIDFEINFQEKLISENQINQKLKYLFESLKYNDLIDEGSKFNTSSTAKIDSFVSQIFMGITYPSQKKVDNYHELLNKFLQKEYSQYLTELNAYQNQLRRTCLVKLVLENNGTSPARNVDVLLHFPDGFQLFDEELAQPDEPRPPQKPEPLDIMSGVSRTKMLDSSLYLPVTPPTNYPIPPSGPSFSIRKTHSYEINFGPLDAIKHNHIYQLPDLYLLFESFAGSSTGFEIDYEITADNLPDKVEGKLTIRLQSI